MRLRRHRLFWLIARLASLQLVCCFFNICVYSRNGTIFKDVRLTGMS